MIGWGAIWAPANRWGMVAASVAFSGGWGRGSQYSAAYQWNRAGYGFDVMLVRSSPEFTVLADLDRGGGQAAQPRRRSQMRGGLWMPIGTGSISAGWLGWREGEEPLREARTLSINQTYQGLTLSGSIFADEQWQAGAALTIGVPLGRRLHATGAATHDRDRSAVRTGLRRSAPYEGGWGWALQGDRLGEFRQAEAELRSRFSEGRLGVEQRNGETRAYLEASGSLVLMAGHFFPSRPIHDAFAVVSTGIRGVQVQIDNRAYGRTGPSGHLLIADLRSWDRNRIAIDTGDLGVGVRIGEVTSIATPADRGGVLVHFDLAEVHPAIVQLLGPDGEVVPPGSRTRRSDTGANVVVGSRDRWRHVPVPAARHR
jgi:outer membrane usher protein